MQTNATKDQGEIKARMLALREQRTAGENQIIHAATNVEALRHISTKEVALLILVDYTNPRPLWHQLADGNQIPAMAYRLGFEGAFYKSTHKKTFAEVQTGASVYVYGYDVDTDAENRHIFDDVPNPEKAIAKDLLKKKEMTQEDFDAIPELIKVPRLKTKDEHDKPLEPQVLMSFRLRWGIDFNKPKSSQSKREDDLYLANERGVPTKEVAIKNPKPNGPKTITVPDWNKCTGLENEIKNILLNTDELEEDTEAQKETKAKLLEFRTEWIPTSPSAPSMQQQAGGTQAGITSPVGSAAATLPVDTLSSLADIDNEEE